MLALALAVLPAARAAAQTQGPLVLAGRALRVTLGGDSVPLAGATVVGHHVGEREQGPVDSVRSDAAGRFRMTVPRPDTGGVYVVSTKFRGIGYFAEPVGLKDRSRSGALELVVFDTSSQGPALAVDLRHLVLTSSDADGSRRVLDIFEVANSGTTTRVAADSNGATWRVRLPGGVANFAIGESDISPSAVRRDGDVMVVDAPFPPGTKQVLVTYVVPRGSRALTIPVDQPTARFDLLVEDSLSSADGPGIQTAQPLTLEGRTFRRFAGEHLRAGATVTLHLGASSDPGRRFAWLIIVVAGLALAGGVVAFLARRRGGAGPDAAPAGESADALAAQIAALDERFEGHETDTPAGEWTRYAERRAALKARLDAALARSGGA